MKDYILRTNRTEIEDCTTLGDLLQFRAKDTPDKKAYAYLKNGMDEDAVLTYCQLDQAARAVAASLVDRTTAGDRALILYPPGVDFLTGFFGSLYAGLVPIPVPPPDPSRLKRTLPRPMAIVQDAGATLVVTTQDISQQMAGSQLDSLDRLTTDTLQSLQSPLNTPLQSNAFAKPLPLDTTNARDLAYLQYTSGSTGNPKGVMLTHDNILHHLQVLQQAFAYDKESISVVWMPNFHDYGLVDGLLQPLYNGTPCYIMSPITFIKKPLLWLKAIQCYRATHTQAPNFAYERCIEKITPAQLSELDLSSMRVASNGAEPIRRQTVLDFLSTFGMCGFPPEALYPAYGLAEATLLVSARAHGQAIEMCHVHAVPLEHEHRMVEVEGDVSASPGTRWIVSCGKPVPGMEVVISHLKNQTQCSEGQVGEIWLADPGVALGYWQRPEESEKIFDNRLTDAPKQGPFLRTGDLGFMKNRELYFTGRLKDLVIIDGVNHYPQDIEWTVQASHPAIRPGHCAAFSIGMECGEQLVVVAEVDPPPEEWEILFRALRRAVAENHELTLHDFVPLNRGGIHKTSSGKVQRSGCCRAYLNGTLNSLSTRHKPAQKGSCPTNQHGIDKNADFSVNLPKTCQNHNLSTPPPIYSHVDTPLKKIRKKIVESAESIVEPAESAEEIRRWLIAALARHLNLPESAIAPQAPFADHGLSSRTAVELLGELEEWLDCELSHTLLWEYPNIEKLSRLLGGVPMEPEPVPTSDNTPGCDNGIAIVSMALRLPGANTPTDFWELLTSGANRMTQPLANRRAEYRKDLVRNRGFHTMDTNLGGAALLDQVDHFDAGLFNITPQEAETMDPQQRLLLEVAWEAFERAGINIDNLAGSDTGVFVGISTDDYAFLQMGDLDTISAYTGPGKALSIAANRISYQFDLKGPSMALDTACSSSLVALHQACQSLKHKECSLALAGGVNLILSPHMNIALSRAGMLAPDGVCKTFDAAADGYVRGEGCALLLLKPLAHAQRDRDPIVGVIRGSAVNQDGYSNGLTAPNGLAQQQVIRRALAAAGVAPSQISYLETHGTGTALGDPIEVKALQAVLSEGRGSGQPCALGGVKANIGHLEAAAGVMGVIKTALSLEQGKIPPHPHVRQLNPLITLKGTPFHIPTTTEPWPAGPRLAGVSSFGFGGTNAHVIMEAPPSSHPGYSGCSVADMNSTSADKAEFPPLYLMTLSARDEPALHALALCWHRHLKSLKVQSAKAVKPPGSGSQEEASRSDRSAESIKSKPPVNLGDLCYSAAVGRACLPQRLTVIGEDSPALQAALKAYTQKAPGAWQTAGSTQNSPSIAFLFTGQGSQYPGMGQELYNTEPIFRQTMEECDAILAPLLKLSVIQLLYGPKPASAAELARSTLAQPLLCSLEYSLARMWMSWGIQPTAVSGHSTGEYAAACIAGVFPLSHALYFVAQRARLINAAPGTGSMMAVMSGEARVRAAMERLEDPHVEIACYNSPQNHVISGPGPSLNELARLLTEEKIQTRLLPVSHAFHSPLMEPFLNDLAEIAAHIHYSPPTLPIYSSVTGLAAGNNPAQPEYWVKHLRAPVRFSSSIQELLKDGVDAFVEIGPQPTLLALARHIADEKFPPQDSPACQCPTHPSPNCGTDQSGAPKQPPPAGPCLWLPSLRPGVADPQQVLESLGALFVHGTAVDWHAFYRNGKHLRCHVPTYPFQRRRYWLSSPEPPPNTAPPGTGTFIGRRVESPLLDKVLFENHYDTSSMPWLDEHQVFEQVVVPGAAHISLVLQAGAALFKSRACTVLDILFPQPLIIPGRDRRRIQLAVDVGDNTHEQSFTLISLPRDMDIENPSWQEHATGRLLPGAPPAPEIQELQAIQAACPHGPRADFYQHIWQPHISLGPQFRWVKEVWQGKEEVLARLSPPHGVLPDLYTQAPGLIDSMLQVLAAAVTVKPDEVLVPFRFKAFHWHGTALKDELWSHLVLQPRQQDADHLDDIMGNVNLFTSKGHMVAQAKGFCARRVKSSNLLPGADTGMDTALYHIQWEPLTPESISAETTQNLGRQLKGLPPAEAAHLLEHHVRELAAGALGISNPGSIGPQQRLFELGLDSLGAVELQNRLAASMGTPLRSTLLFDFPTLTALMDHLQHHVLKISDSNAGEVVPASDLAQSLEGLSQEALAELLSEELKI